MEIKYPKNKTSIDDMYEIIDFFGIKAVEYTDSTIVFEATYEQLSSLYNLGKDHAVSSMESD